MANNQYQQHFDAMVQNQGRGVVSVRYISEAKGRGLFAGDHNAFKKDEYVFTEKPVCALQHFDNRQAAVCCANCFRFLGTLEEQLRYHQSNIDNLDTIDGMTEASNAGNQQSSSSSSAVASNAAPKFTCFECFGGCGEQYCSEQCRGDAFQRHHRFLCVGPITDPQHPLVLFKQYAIEHYELFLLTAQAIAMIIGRWESNGKDINDAMLPFAAMHRRHWWQIKSEEQTTKSPEHLKRMLAESLSLLSAAFGPYLKQQPGGDALAAILFNFDFYSLLTGLLEINNNSIEIRSPLQAHLIEIIEKMTPEEPVTPESIAAAKEAQALWTNTYAPLVERILNVQDEEDAADDDDDDDDDDEMGDGEEGADDAMEEEDASGKPRDLVDRVLDTPFVFPPLQGLGVFPLEAVMNHSCVPNCLVLYPGGDNTAHVLALRDIQPGEELVHSYIENEAPLHERTQDLLGYGFTCDCALCEQDRRNQKKKNKGTLARRK